MRAMLYDVATWADTSSNQAIKDHGVIAKLYKILLELWLPNV